MRIHPALSSLLDFLRFLLAAMVVWGHWTHAFPYDWPDLLRLASVAVGAFFVLSGFTIYAITREVAPAQAPGFAVERLSRLWSVALPALAATILIELAARALSPAYYAGCCGDTAEQPVLRIAVNALFLGELWGWGLSPLSNTPFWSLCYEAMFYVLFAAWLWTRDAGWRRVLVLALLLVLFGPTFLPYFGLWLVGVLLAKLYLELPRAALIALSLATLTVLVGGLVVHGLWLWIYKIALFSYELEHSIKLFYPDDAPGLQWLSTSLVGGALAVTALLLLAMAWMPPPVEPVPRGLAKPGLARWCGEATFPLYLLHYPMIVPLSAWVFRADAGPSMALQLAVLALIFALAFLAVKPCEALKFRLRRALTRRWWPERAIP